MAKAETGTPRAPRGTKPVSVAFFSALDAAPEGQRSAIARAAQVMIRDQLRTRREKAKLASERARANGKVQLAAKVTPPRQAAASAQPVRSAGAATGKSAAAKGKAATASSGNAKTPKTAAKQVPAKASTSKAAKATQPSVVEEKAEPQPGSAKRAARSAAKPTAATE